MTHFRLSRPRGRRLPLRLHPCEARTLPSSSIPLSTVNWTALGPAPLLNAQTPGGLNATGRASGVAVHPTDANTIYVATAGGGVWKTTDGGATNPNWVSLTDNEASQFMGAVTIAPSNPNIIYAGTGEQELRALSFYGKGVLKSTDAGATWSLMGASLFDRTTIGNIVVHPTNPDIVFVGVGNHGTDCDPTKPTGVYRSTDGGLTWTNTTAAITTSEDFTDVEPDPNNVNVMWAAVGSRLGSMANGVYRTTNALAASPTWTLISNIAFGVNVGRTEIAVAPSNSQVVYVVMANPSTGNLFRWYQTTTGGTTWTDRTSTTPGTDRMWFCLNLLVDPTNASLIYYSGTTNLLYSTNGGANWTPINSGADGRGPHVDHHGFAFDSLGRFIVVGDGGIYRWTPSTNLWVSVNGVNTTRTASGAINSIQFMGIGIHPTDPDFIIGGTQDNGLNRFTDSLGWTLTEGGDGGDVVIDPFNPNRMWRANPVASFGASAFVRRSTNGGSSWSSIVSGLTNPTLSAFYPPMAADPGTPDRIFMGSNVLNVSTNAGTNWTRLPGDTFTFPNEIRGIGIGPAASGVIYVSCGASADGTAGAYSANQVFVTTNNGATWTERTPQSGGDFNNFAVDPTNSNICYAVNANFSSTGDNVFKTTNAGATWTPLGATLVDAPFYDIVLDPGPTNAGSDDVLYVGGDQGVWRSLDQGVTWAKFGNGLAISQVRDLEYAPATKILAAATHGRGVWQILTGIPNVPGQIAGNVYNDLNADAALSAGEPGLGGWVVYRDDNANGLRDDYGTSTVAGPGTPIPLPDLATTTATLDFTGLTGVVTDVNVSLDITHTFDGDLQVFLTSPTGTKVTLFANVGGAGQNFTGTTLDDEAPLIITGGAAPFTGIFQPQGLLSNFDGGVPNGTWTLTISDVGPQDIGTLNSWSITMSTGEHSAVSRSDGAYELKNNPSGSYNLRRVLQAGWFATEPAAGVQAVTVTPGNGVTGVNFGQTQTQPPRVANVIINNGDAQRSRVTQVRVDFDQLVTFTGSPEAAFQLKRQSDNAIVGLSAAVTNTTTTSVTLTFTGAVSEATSLADGRYTLTVLANQVANGPRQLDGNANGIAGDDYVLAAAGSPPTGIFRLFGDADGDGDVDAADFGAFRAGFATPQAVAIFDADNDGDVDAADFGAFRMRFGSSV